MTFMMTGLIHIELSARSPFPYPRKPCSDCGSIHKEIFPMTKLSKGSGDSGDVDGGGVGGGQEYEMVRERGDLSMGEIL